MSASHYEVLGVPLTATTAELRHAYLERARHLHPDRWIDAGPAERASSERRMREVNEAWRVLGDVDRRRSYDAGQGTPSPVPGTATRFTAADYQSVWTVDDDEVLGQPVVTRLVAVLPWVLVVAAVVGIFVFTAYAGGPAADPTQAPGEPAHPSCATLQPGGLSALASPCGPTSFRVLSEVSGNDHCVAGDLVPRAGAVTAFCLERP